MNQKIKVDIVSDVVCPWCVIGYKRLELAINELGLKESVEINWQPFELNSHMPIEGENLRRHLANKYGTSLDESIKARVNLTNLGEEVDFKFDYFDDMKMVNTHDAHMLLQWSAQFDKQTNLKEALFSAFFGERKDISNRETLGEILKQVDLSDVDGLVYLDNSKAKAKLEQSQLHWRKLGIDSVPTVVFNMESAVTGAHSVENYKQVLSELSGANQ